MDVKKRAQLGKQLLYTGLGDIPQTKLDALINENKPEFTIPLKKEFGGDKVEVSANFRKGKEDYFFNSYQVEVTTEKGEKIKLNIKVSKPAAVADGRNPDSKEWVNSTITLKEAYNLACGRAVNNDFVKVVSADNSDANGQNQKYNAWQMADFKNPTAEGYYPLIKFYNFDLEKALEGYPFLEMQNEKYKAELLESLKRGNLQKVTYQWPDSTAEKMSIEANPVFKPINIYDEHGNQISLNMKAPTQEVQVALKDQSQNQQQGQSQSASQRQSNSAAEDDPDKGPKQSNGKRIHQGI